MPGNDFVDGVQNIGIIAGFIGGIYAWIRGLFRIAQRSRLRTLKKFNEMLKESEAVRSTETVLSKLLETTNRLAEEIERHMEREEEDRKELREALKVLSDRLDTHLNHHH